MSKLLPSLDDVFNIAHREGKREALEKVIKVLESSGDLFFLKVYIQMELHYLNKESLLDVLKAGTPKDTQE